MRRALHGDSRRGPFVCRVDRRARCIEQVNEAPVGVHECSDAVESVLQLAGQLAFLRIDESGSSTCDKIFKRDAPDERLFHPQLFGDVLHNGDSADVFRAPSWRGAVRIDTETSPLSR